MKFGPAPYYLFIYLAKTSHSQGSLQIMLATYSGRLGSTWLGFLKSAACPKGMTTETIRRFIIVASGPRVQALSDSMGYYTEHRYKLG